MTTPGKIYHAKTDPRLQSDLLVFVPDNLLISEDQAKPPKLKKEEFVQSGWAHHNVGANPEAIGSHLFPDLTRPYDKQHPMYDIFTKKINRIAKNTPQPQI